MSSKIKIALLQIDIEMGKPEFNFAKCEAMLEKAMAESSKPDVIMLPEMWNTGYGKSVV